MTFDQLPPAWRDGVAHDEQDRELRVRAYQRGDTARAVVIKELLAAFRRADGVQERDAINYILRRLRGTEVEYR